MKSIKTLHLITLVKSSAWQQQILRYGLISFLALGLLGCQNGVNFKNGDEKCRYGKPVAIFSSKLPEVAQHEFTCKDQVGEETIQFKDGKQLIFIQSGCNDIRQELQFTLMGLNYPDEPDFWIQKATEELLHLSQVNKKLAAFSMWASMIQSQKSDIHLSESFELAQGFYVQIDRIPSSNHSLLVVVLSDHPE
jgi:hypothetical protein